MLATIVTVHFVIFWCTVENQLVLFQSQTGHFRYLRASERNVEILGLVAVDESFQYIEEETVAYLSKIYKEKVLVVVLSDIIRYAVDKGDGRDDLKFSE